jgi:photosystem II stability/assembly factor-like uncharacterized protein
MNKKVAMVVVLLLVMQSLLLLSCKVVGAGYQWVHLKNGLLYNPYSLAIDPTNTTTMYVGTYGDGIFKSTNGGTSWSAIDNGLTNSAVYSLVIDPTNTNTIYAGTWGGGIFKSTNGGTSWSAINTGLTYLYIFSLVIDPTNTNIIYAVTGEGIFKYINKTS